MPKIIVWLSLILAVFFYGLQSRLYPLLYLDVVLVLFLPAFLFAMAGVNYKRFFRLVFRNDKTIGLDEVKLVQSAMQSLGILVLLTGALGSLMGLILMLQNLNSPSAIGPAMSVSLLSVLFALILRLLIYTIEYNLAGRYHLWDQFLKKQSGEWSVFLYGLFVLLSFFILLFAMS